MSNGDPAKPRVAFFLPNVGGGGAERVIITLSKEFAARGYHADLVLASGDGELGQEIPANVEVVNLKAGRVALAWWPLLRYLRKNKPAALLSTLEHANILAILISPFVRHTKVVIREANTATVDTDARSLRGRSLLAAMRLVYPFAGSVIAVSEGVATELKAKLGVKAERISVIPNPVLNSEVFAKAREPVSDPWLDGALPLVLAVGRLVPQKGFDVLLKAFAKVRSRTEARLIVLGEGPLRSELEQQAEDLGIGEHVRFPGFISNPYAYMSGADVFVLSSRWEGLPNVLIQAMGVGAPAVATDCKSGPSEVLEGGRFGHLVPVDDNDSMASAILEALDGDRRLVDEAWKEGYLVSGVADRYATVLGFGRQGLPG